MRRPSALSAKYAKRPATATRSEEHTSELQSLRHLVCRLLLEKKTRRTRRTSTMASLGTIGRPHARTPATWLDTLRVRARRPAAPPLFALRSSVFFFLRIRAPPGFHPFPQPGVLPV